MKTILAPIDFSDASTAVVEAAATLARAFQAKLVLMHVSKSIPNEMLTIDRFALGRAIIESEQLENWYKRLKTDGFPIETVQLSGEPGRCIREEAELRKADFLVIGSHGHGALYDLLLGSTAKSVLQKSRCPVLVVPIFIPRTPLFDSRAEPGALPEYPASSPPAA